MAIKNMYTMSDEEILRFIATRLKRLRLDRNMSREEVAQDSGRAANTVKNLEKGIGSLASLIPILRSLRALEQLNNLVPEPPISPILLMKQPSPRQRARKRKDQ